MNPNKKLLVIQVLKQRISNMQQQLHKLENQPSTNIHRSKSKNLSKSKDLKSSPIRHTSSNKRYKSPTFWTGNPLLGEQNPYFSQKSISPSNKIQRNRSFTTKQPLLQKIQNDVDLNFYQSVPTLLQTFNKQFQSIGKQNLITFKKQEKMDFNKKYQTKPNYQSKRWCQQFSKNSKNNPKNNQNYPILKNQKSEPKIQKKKTYVFPRKDPILNPQPNKVSSKKIHPKPQGLAPKEMFIQNPHSNPNLYFYDTQPVKLSPKVNNLRNTSPDLKLLLSNSSQNLQKCNQTPTSNKKHYSKYYKDNLVSQWNINW